jgi:bifunctional non-homologous end joining protein LigD
VHVYVPLDSGARYEETKPFARAVATLLVRRHPDRVVERMAQARRAGKVFVDWAQNDASKSTAGVYTLRGQGIPVVSAPVAWEELEAAVAAGDEGRLVFTAPEVLERIQRDGGLFACLLDERQSLPAL